MTISRRYFLRAGSLALFATGVHLTAHAGGQKIGAAQQNPKENYPVPYQSQLDPTSYFTKATFTPYLNTPFRLRLKGATLATLTLVEVNDVRSGRKQTTTVGLSLIFRGPASKSLQSQMYKVEHGALGSFSLFITPVERDAGRQRAYEAVINHLP